jgi:hypothetical protein
LLQPEPQAILSVGRCGTIGATRPVPEREEAAEVRVLLVTSHRILSRRSNPGCVRHPTTRFGPSPRHICESNGCSSAHHEARHFVTKRCRFDHVEEFAFDHHLPAMQHRHADGDLASGNKAKNMPAIDPVTVKPRHRMWCASTIPGFVSGVTASLGNESCELRHLTGIAASCNAMYWSSRFDSCPSCYGSGACRRRDLPSGAERVGARPARPL